MIEALLGIFQVPISKSKSHFHHSTRGSLLKAGLRCVYQRLLLCKSPMGTQARTIRAHAMREKSECV